MELACIITCNDLKLLLSLECLFEGGWRVLGMIRLQPVELNGPIQWALSPWCMGGRSKRAFMSFLMQHTGREWVMASTLSKIVLAS